MSTAVNLSIYVIRKRRTCFESLLRYQEALPLPTTMASVPVKPLPFGRLQHLLRNITPTVPRAQSMFSASFKHHHFLGLSSYDICIYESVRHMRNLRSWSTRRRVIKSPGVSMPVASAEDLPAASWKPEKTTVAPSLSDVIWPAAD